MELDELDRQLVHALQIDGQAPFSAIAPVLGVSDQTVARRYRRLREAGVMRVVGLPDVGRFGSAACLIRVQCAPTRATEIARALSRRDDTSWVSLVAGGTEIVCVTRTVLGSEQAPLLLQELPRTPRVEGVVASYILRMFSGGPTGWYGKAHALTDEQVRRIAGLSAGPPAEGRSVELRAGDRELLAALATDGRTKAATLASLTGLSEAGVRRRIEQLRQSRALFFDVEIDHALLGYETAVMLWLSVDPADLVSVGQRISEHRETVFAAAITGATSLMAISVCRNFDAFYTYLTTRIGALEGVRHAETAPVIRSVKQAGSLSIRW